MDVKPEGMKKADALKAIEQIDSTFSVYSDLKFQDLMAYSATTIILHDYFERGNDEEFRGDPKHSEFYVDLVGRV